jgi:hypothetical protein
MRRRNSRGSLPAAGAAPARGKVIDAGWRSRNSGNAVASFTADFQRVRRLLQAARG